MAQVVKLKRTSVQGRVPNISNLELGELAINTHDGRIFFEKDDGTLSIQEILTTNSSNSGSFNIQGAISASSLSISGNTTIGGNLVLGGNITIGDSDSDSVSFSSDISSSFLPDSNLEFDLGSDTKKWNNLYVGTASADFFVGDGSGLTNLQVSSSIVEATTVTSSFDNESTITVVHSFDSKNVIVSVYDTEYSQLIPQSVTLTDNDTVDIVLSNTGSGHVVVAKGGHFVTGVYVDDITVLSDNFTNETLYTVNHLFDTKDVIVTVYDTNDSQIIPQSIVTSTLDTVEIGFETPTSGRVVVAKAGHVVSGTIPFNNITEVPTLVSSSDQVTSSLDSRYVETSEVTGSNVVGSDTITSIQTMTSAAYGAITPETNVLYIITD